MPVYINDILISGSTLHKHLQIIDVVPTKLHNSGLKLNQTKFYFLQDWIRYHFTSSTKTVCIWLLRKYVQFKKRKHHKTLVNFNCSSALSIITIDFYQTSQQCWHLCTASSKKMLSGHGNWSRRKCLLKLKALQDDSLLVHYNESKPLILAYDASKCGLGAVLSHTMYRDTSCLCFQNTHSHWKELFWIREPLSYLFNETKGVFQTASSRIQGGL